MSDIRHSKEDALDRVQYLDLYRGAARVSDEFKRIAAIVMVLCTGRLAMRIGEVMHLHEGWINWKKGYIKIPRFEPCACKYCWKRAENNVDSEFEEPTIEEIVEYLYSNQWSPKSENGARIIPFNWSARITAALVTFFAENVVIDENYKWTERTMKNFILNNTEFLQEGDVMWHGLRATGITFWADANIGAKAERDAAGYLRETDSSVYRAHSPVQLSNKMRRAVGKEPLSFETTDFVALDPRPIAKEPFDPRDINPQNRDTVFERGPKTNPRTPDLPDGVEYNETKFDSLAMERDLPTASERRALVKRIEAEREGNPETDVDDPYLEAASQEEESLPGQVKIAEYTDSLGADESGVVTPLTAFKAGYVALAAAISWGIASGTPPLLF